MSITKSVLVVQIDYQQVTKQCQQTYTTKLGQQMARYVILCVIIQLDDSNYVPPGNVTLN